MAKRASVDVAFFLVDGLSLLGYVTNLSDGKEALTEDTKPLGQAWPAPAPTGDKQAEFGQNGWYDDASNGTNGAFSGQQGVNRVLCFGVSGNTAGQPFAGYVGIYASKYTRVVSKGALHKANASYAITGAAEDGVILHPLGAETAAGNSEGATSVDRNAETTVPVTAITSSSVANPSVITCPRPHGLANGDKVVIAGHSGSTPSINAEYVATVLDTLRFTIPVNVTVGGTGGTVKRVSTQLGGAGYLQLTALTLGGYTNLACKVRHSQDDATYADLVTFTVRTAIGAERVAVAGNVYRHLASSWAFTGAGSNPSATFLIGFARNL
jgi:hypothetical protein